MERFLAEVQAIYGGVSQEAEVFVIEHDGLPVGDGWVQEMNLARITTAFPGHRLARVDLQLAHDVWGRRLGTRAIRLLTARAFDRDHDLVFAVDVADFNHRSRRAFLRCGYVPWRRLPSPAGAPTAFVHDVVCRPALFRGTASVEAHPGKDRIRATIRPTARRWQCIAELRRSRCWSFIAPAPPARATGRGRHRVGPASGGADPSLRRSRTPREDWPRPRASSGDGGRRGGLGGLRRRGGVGGERRARLRPAVVIAGVLEVSVGSGRWS